MVVETLSRVSEFGDELAARLARAADPAADPGALADLFRTAYGESEEALVVGRSLRAELLRRTLVHAVATTPRYAQAERYADFIKSQDWRAPLRLGDLPVITRQDVSDAPLRMLADDVETAWISHTAGSTGLPVSMPRAWAEVRFQQAYFQRMIDEAAAYLPRRPLVLTFPNTYHGVPTPLPSLGKVFAAAVTDDVVIGDAVRVLQGRYDFKGHDEHISILSGLGFHVTFFTSFLLEQGLDPADFGVNSVNITGAYVPEETFRFLRQSWQARIFDRFTLTEIVGGAGRTASDEPFQVDPYCLAEVLDADTGRPLEEGVGHLVMTSLYPFARRQPMIRYRTGDLVRVRRHDGNSVTAFEFLGKSKNCLGFQREGRTAWVLCSAKLNDALTRHPDVRLYDWFLNVRLAADPSVGSQPFVRASLEPGPGATSTLLIEVELRYAPHCYADRRQALEDAVTAQLRTDNPELDQALRSGALALCLRFLAPGKLGAATTFKI